MNDAVLMAPRVAQEGEVLPLLARHEIQVLLRAGFSQADVARRTGASARTVRRVALEEQVSHGDDRQERDQRGIGRPSKAAPFAERVKAWLKETPELPTLELLRRARDAGYPGNKSAFYALVAAVRPPRAAPVVRFEGLPGEFSQHDFGQVEVTFDDGRTKRVHFFASRLKYSRYAAVRIVPNERTETLIRSLAHHMVEFGGLPLLAVFDRPRTIVKKSGRGRDVEQWNSTFAQAVVELGINVEMCAPRSGNQKGSVERLVGWVKNSFFKHQKFVDEADLEAKLAAWVHHINHEVACRATALFPETRRREELARLRSIKVVPEKLALRIPAFVGPTAEVVFEGVSYMMPPEATHVPATIFLYEDRLRIVAGRWEVEHARRQKGESRASTPDLRAAKLSAVHGRRAKLYEKRQQLLDLGADVLTLLTEIIHRAPRLANRRVEELYAAFERHGDAAFRAAVSKVVAAGTLTASAVLQALKKGARRRASLSSSLRRGATARSKTLRGATASRPRGASKGAS